jgi:hypothetical protein
VIRASDLSPAVRAKILGKATKRKVKPKLEPYESEEQAAYFSWLYYLRYEGKRIWDFAYAVPNGAFLAGTPKQRAIQARKLIKQGLKPGYPDLGIDIAVAPYYGLRIEMKRIGAPKPKPGDDQSMWHARLREQGYYVAVCFGLKQAQAVTLEYFGLTGKYQI